LNLLADEVSRRREQSGAPNDGEAEPMSILNQLETHARAERPAVLLQVPATPGTWVCVIGSWGEGQRSVVESRIITQAKDQDDGRT
jgi:hypothetical protein